MDETLNRLTAIEVKDFTDIFEKTLLEISILDSLYGSSNISDYVKNVFRTSIKDLQDSETLKTLADIIDEDEPKNEESEHKDERKRAQQRCSNAEQLMQDYVSLEKKIQELKQEEEEIDSTIEKCTEDGEHTAIRKETEKNYVEKWEKARVENFKFKFKSEEIELRKEMTELHAKLETEILVDAENKKFLDYSINELEKQIDYWECKYKTDIKDIDEKLKNLNITFKVKTKVVDSLKKTYNERQTIIEEHAQNKQKLEEEKKINDHMEKMATKIQAWWRGTMVRRRLGPYKNLLGPRKKSIKKPLTNKGKRTNVK